MFSLQGIVGRPRLVLSKEAIEGYLDMGYSVSQTAEACGVSRSVLYSRMQQLGISYRDRFSRLDNNSLDAAVTDIKMSHPNCGEVMIIGHLRARGIIVQRSRVRESIHRVDPQGADDRRCRGIRRRVYSVPCPNFIWHLDGNHKLIRWRFVVHVGIDGFSRLVVFCQCSDNNTSQTVSDLFQRAVSQYGRPLKVRTDKGGENVRVWDEMVNHSPAGEMAAITGSSVHNQRVERFNRDLNIHCADVVKLELYELEHQGLLDPSNDTDLFCLHYVYVPRINQLLQEFVNAHNHHSISTENNLTPLQLFNNNQHLLSLHSVTPQQDLRAANLPRRPRLVEVPPICNPLSDEFYRNLCHEIDPLMNISRIDLYKQVIEYVGNCLLEM